jgi:hypothetical protein
MRTAVLLFLAVVTTTAQANRFEVTSLENSGNGTLRWAITRANERVGADKIIFDEALSGGSIRPKTPLPEVTDQLTIDGHINDDAKPDIVLSGADCEGAEGLRLTSDYNVIQGLCVNSWPGCGLLVYGGSDHNQILGCYFGTDLAGTAKRYNTGDDLWLDNSLYNTIGGDSEAERNVFACGHSSESHGVRMNGGGSDRVFGNYFGVGSDGLTAIGSGESTALYLVDEGSTCSGNCIGGATPGRRNLFGNVYYGIRFEGAGTAGNYVVGNYIGLAADGDTVAGCEFGIYLSGATDNQIGGENPGQRNVIAGNGGFGVYGYSAPSTRIQGNYIGLNAAGTAARGLQYCVYVVEPSDDTTIGSANTAGGNYLATADTDGQFDAAVLLQNTGTGVLVRNNHFGVTPGGASLFLDRGVWLIEAPAKVRGNELVGSQDSAIEIHCQSSETMPLVIENSFRQCYMAVQNGMGSFANLGNLSNSDAADDGANVFDPSNVWHIMNYNASRLKAEGNNFGTMVASQIDSRIFDKQDHPEYGRVDFDPLIGGVHPTGAGPLAVAALSAAATRAGAQVVFSLSAAASVEARVLNMAGRPIRGLCGARECPPGRNTLLWDGRDGTGAAVPRGTYLAEVVARGRDGSRCRAVTSLRLER